MKHNSASPGYYAYGEALPKDLRELVVDFLDEDETLLEDEVTAVEAPRALRSANARGEKKTRSGEYARADFAEALYVSGGKK